MKRSGPASQPWFHTLPTWLTPSRTTALAKVKKQTLASSTLLLKAVPQVYRSEHLHAHLHQILPRNLEGYCGCQPVLRQLQQREELHPNPQFWDCWKAKRKPPEVACMNGCCGGRHSRESLKEVQGQVVNPEIHQHWEREVASTEIWIRALLHSFCNYMVVY